MKKAVIIGSGECDAKDIDFSQYKFIIGCDGGAQYLSDAGVVPHAIMGDFDSLDPAVIMEMFMLGVARRGFPEEKDFTDMKGAVDFVSGFDYGQIDFYGATGTRLDHSLGNMMLLFELYQKGIKGRIIDKTNIITAICADGEPASIELDDIPEGWYVSFVPVGECSGVTIKGLKYTADNLDLGIENATRAISNEAADESAEPASVELKSGKLLIFYSKD